MVEVEEHLRLLIVYYSRFGAIKALAEQVALGVRRVEGAEVTFFAVEDLPGGGTPSEEDAEGRTARRAAAIAALGAADTLIVGSPAYFGSMAAPVKRFFEDTVAGSNPGQPGAGDVVLRDKFGAAFTSSATPHGGNEQALHSILTMLMHLGMLVVTPGQQMPILENDSAPYGATVVTGATGDRPMTDQEQDAARAFGERVATVAMWLALGRAGAHHAERNPYPLFRS